MFRFCCLVLLAVVFSVGADPSHERESGFVHKYTQRQGRRVLAEDDSTPLVDNRYIIRQNNQQQTTVYRPQESRQNIAEGVNNENLEKIKMNSEHEQEDDAEELDEEDDNENIPFNNVQETQGSRNEGNGPLIKFTQQQQQEVEKVQNEINHNKQMFNQGLTADSRRFEVGPNYPVDGHQSGDSGTNSASTYSSMLLHEDPEQQRSSLVPQFKAIRGKPTKVYAKPNRPLLRESPINYTPLRNIQQGDPPPQHLQQIPVTPTPGDPFVHSVHPSIMKSLLKQQPQTFDLPQKDAEDFENPSNNWNVNSDSKSSNAEQNYNSYKTFSPQDSTNDPNSFDMNKRPIYVPNRVSIQNPSSDSSFNVGYSIGFGGTGLVQQPKMSIVQPPISFRQGKEVNYPSSYQNTPINVHFDGKDTVWKNMGNGVEMSHSMDSNLKEYNDYTSNYQNEHSSGRVINQPLFHRETYDEKFSSLPTAGRNSFDHNHALQQSNTFDFSNAIDPVTNLPYSTEQKSSFFSSPAYKETFLKQAIPSYIESFPKQYQGTFSESSSKHVRPFLESSQYLSSIHPNIPHLSQSGVTTSGRVNYEGGSYERPAHSESPSALIKTTIPTSHKAKAIDFSKSTLKPSFTFKHHGGSTLNHFGEDLYGHNVGFSGMPVVPQVYGPAGKPTSGMVQAFLVPVNSPVQSFPYSVGMPMMGHGFPPYFGHPIGVLRMPEHLASPYRAGYEHSDVAVNSPSDTQQFATSHQSPPMKVVHSHYSAAIKHQKELPTESSLYHTQRVPQEAGEHRHPMKFKRLYTTESPEHAHPALKTQTPSSHSSADMPEVTTPPHTHHLRPYRKGSMIIVKRT